MMRLIPILLLLALVGADLILHRHAYFAIEATPGFYALFALAVSVAVVIVSRLLSPLLRMGESREEDD